MNKIWRPLAESNQLFNDEATSDTAIPTEQSTVDIRNTSRRDHAQVCRVANVRVLSPIIPKIQLFFNWESAAHLYQETEKLSMAEHLPKLIIISLWKTTWNKKYTLHSGVPIEDRLKVNKVDVWQIEGERSFLFSADPSVFDYVSI